MRQGLLLRLLKFSITYREEGLFELKRIWCFGVVHVAIAQMWKSLVSPLAPSTPHCGSLGKCLSDQLLAAAQTILPASSVHLQ